MAKIGINIKEGSIAKPSKPVVVGIDLGTTNSLVAVVKDGKNQVLTEDDGSHRLVPSVIYFDEDMTPTTGDLARERIISDPEHTIFSVKRLMGKSYHDVAEFQQKSGFQIIEDDEEKLVRVQVRNKYFTPIELSAVLLARLKEQAEQALGQPVEQAVITVPAYFNDSQRQATRDAGKLAGLNVLRIVNEPTAAALAYGIGQDRSSEETIAVYDLGGGTFDISILQLTDGIFEVLSTHGDTYLGGDDLDHAIVDYWIEKQPELKPHIKSLKWYAEEAKKALSTQDEVVLDFKDFTLTITKEDFEAAARGIIERTMNSCKQALSDAKLQREDIDRVILVGGSTRSPIVKNTVEEFFGQKPYDNLNPDEIVAQGAAVQADILAGNRKDLLLLDITPLSLGIETVGGLMDVIIPRNTSIPMKAAREYTTSIDGQANLKVAVFQGERDLVENNRKLGEFILRGIPPMAAGIPKIQIAFMIDANGILQVKASELRSQTEQQVEIRSQFGISEEDMARMLKDSIVHAKSDMELRGIKEAQVEAEQLLRSMDTFKSQHAIIVASQLNEIEAREEKLREALQGQSKDAIMAAMDELNDFTRPFAERAMDATIASAMKGKKI